MAFSLHLLSLAAASLLGWAAPTPASAQVVRCTDARTGAITYTDGECTAGTRAREVQARQTPEEIAQERAEAAQARAEKQQRLQAETAAQQLENERQAQRQRDQAARAAAAQTPAQAYARSSECARSRRNFDLAASSARYDQSAQLQAAQRQMELDCLGPEGYAAVERNRPAPQSPPIVVYPQYPPAHWSPHQYPPYPHRPRPPRPPHLPPPEQPTRPPSFLPRPSFGPLPSFTPLPSQQNPAIDRRCIGRGCEDAQRR